MSTRARDARGRFIKPQPDPGSVPAVPVAAPVAIAERRSGQTFPRQGWEPNLTYVSASRRVSWRSGPTWQSMKSSSSDGVARQSG